MNVVDPARDVPQPVTIVGRAAAETPFVGPETLARSRGGGELIRLGANESAFGPAPAVFAAMVRSLSEINWYGDPEHAELRAALAVVHGRPENEILVASGIDDLLGLLVRAYVGADGTALATDGSYATFVYHVRGYGGRLATVPYLSDGRVDLDSLATAARANPPHLIYLANPDNPSGSMHGRAVVDAWLAALPPTSLVVLDEAYADFLDPLELSGAVPANVVRTRTFSKAHGLAGARIGYLLAAPAVVRALEKIRHHFGVARTAQAGALAALGEPAYLASVVARVAEGRADYAALGRRLGTPAQPSHTNFVCFDLGSQARAEAAVRGLLARGIFVRKPGRAPLSGWIRVSVGTPDQRERFAAAYAETLTDLSESSS